MYVDDTTLIVETEDLRNILNVRYIEQDGLSLNMKEAKIVSIRKLQEFKINYEINRSSSQFQFSRHNLKVKCDISLQLKIL